MKQQNSKKLFLNKKTVSVLKANEMTQVKGGALDAGTTNGSKIICGPSDSFVACGSCFGACPTNGTVSSNQPLTIYL